MTTARTLIDRYVLRPHPEGGWYRELYRSAVEITRAGRPRAAVTSIYFLLEAEQYSRWHVVDADELWHFYGGAPLELLAYDPRSGKLATHVLDAPRGDRECLGVIPAGVWQAARSLGEYSFVGCSVAPGFEFQGFRFVADLPAHAAPFASDLKAWRHLL